MVEPVISVIVPCYNQAQYLDECLQSVLDQTFSDWECIIVNDGSPDNTEEVARKWVERDERFKYLEQENKGVSAARNFGIENAKGEWILPLDADDYISDNYLQLASSFFSVQLIKVIYSDAIKFGAVNQKFELPPFTLVDLAIQNVIFCSAFFRKKDWEAVSGFDESMTAGYEDWDLWISILKHGGEVIRLNEICFFYRIKKESRNIYAMQNSSQILEYLEKKHFNFFYKHLGSMHKLYQKNLRNELALDILLRKRKLSRLINRIYSFLENLQSKNKT